MIIVLGIGVYAATRPTPSSTSPQAMPSLETVDFMMNFLANGGKVPYYVGLDRGFFAKYGLQVNVIPNAAGPITALHALAAGKVQFTEGDFGTFVTMVAKENITNVRAVAMLYGTNPTGFLFLKGKGHPAINNPKDLEGKTVGTFPGSANEAMLPLFCKGAGIDCNKLIIQHASAATLIPSLLAGKFDAVIVYTRLAAGMQADAAKNGLEIGTINYADYGVDIYADSIMTTTDIIQKKPDLVKHFLQGLEEATQFAGAHPDDAVDSTLKFTPQLNRNITLGEWLLTMPYMGGKGTIVNAKNPLSLGWMDPKKVEFTVNVVAQAFQITPPNTSLLYTDQFVTPP